MLISKLKNITMLESSQALLMITMLIKPPRPPSLPPRLSLIVLVTMMKMTQSGA